MAEAKCKKCDMPLENQEDRCSCNAELCRYCCECEATCQCGCRNEENQ